MAADANKCLYALVPLHCLLKLGADSTVLWKSEFAVHHDIALVDSQVAVLHEVPAVVEVDEQPHIVLDSRVQWLNAETGEPGESLSVLQALQRHPLLRAEVEHAVKRSRARAAQLPASDQLEIEKAMISTIRDLDEGKSHTSRDNLVQLRELPSEPCDLLHINSLQVVTPEVAGYWREGTVITSVRELNRIVAIDPGPLDILWEWGYGELDGQHQPRVTNDGIVTVFDDGRAAKRSRILQVDPRTDTIIWTWNDDGQNNFFTDIAGGCEVLSNGLILATEAEQGRAILVDRSSGEVATWSIPPCGSSASRASLYRLASVPNWTADPTIVHKQEYSR